MVSTSKASFMFVCGGLSTEQPKGALLGMKWETTILRQAQRKTVWADTRFPRKARYSSMTAGLRPSQGNLWGWATTHTSYTVQRHGWIPHTNMISMLILIRLNRASIFVKNYNKNGGAQFLYTFHNLKHFGVNSMLEHILHRGKVGTLIIWKVIKVFRSHKVKILELCKIAVNVNIAKKKLSFKTKSKTAFQQNLKDTRYNCIKILIYRNFPLAAA